MRTSVPLMSAATCGGRGGAVLAIVDDPRSAHGRLMESVVREHDEALHIVWVIPALDLPERLHALDGAHAVALPLSVRGAGRRDRFTARIAAALDSLTSRGIGVFVSELRPGANALARRGTACLPRASSPNVEPLVKSP